MSHTTVIKSVPIKDINAVRSAVEELNASGVSCELVDNAVPRMWRTDQHGRCTHVLKLKDGQYDVGFDQKEDGSFEMVTDFYGNHISNQLGATGKADNCTNEQRAMGRFTQLYAKHVAINTAVAQGYMVTNSYFDDDSNVQLEVALPA